MTKSLLSCVAALVCLADSARAHDGIFRTWFEAPMTVAAGESASVWLWATYEEGGVPAVDGWYSTVQASIEVSGDTGSFASISPILDGLPFRVSAGEPDGLWLRDFSIFQHSNHEPFDGRNPLPVAMFEIETVPGQTGILQFDLRAPTGVDVPWLTWWDDRTFDWIQTIDDGVGLEAATGSIRVIPAPPSLGLFVCAGLGVLRRRR